MADVLVLFGFCLSLFGVLGVQLFKGTLLYRCYEKGAPLDGTAVPIDPDAGVCPPPTEVGEGRYTSCASTQECRFYGTNPVDGTISFDNILSALMTIFQCVTLEGWVDVMYAAMKVAGPATALYFILLIALGAFYVLNLFLAVLWETYIESYYEEAEQADAEKAIAHAKEMAEQRGMEARKATLDEMQRQQAGRAALGGEDQVVSFEEVTQRQRLLDEHGPGRSDQAQAVLVAARTPPKPNPCVRAARSLSHAASFQHFVIGLIVLNTAAMMFESYPMDALLAKRLDTLNVYLTLAFASEMVLKLIADGLVEYVADAFNRFDGVVVIFSLADLIVSYLHIDLGVNASVLRAFRLLRVFRLVRSWRNLRIVLQAMLNAVGQLTNLFVLLLLLIFIFALLGMSLFGGAYTRANGWTEDSPPRTNFDSMISSMLTVFVVISGENWNDVWSQTSSVVGQWCAPYFVILVVLGNYVVLNLFVAILLGGFSELEPDDDDDGAGGGEGEGEGAGSDDRAGAGGREDAGVTSARAIEQRGGAPGGEHESLLKTPATLAVPSPDGSSFAERGGGGGGGSGGGRHADRSLSPGGGGSRVLPTGHAHAERLDDVLGASVDGLPGLPAPARLPPPVRTEGGSPMPHVGSSNSLGSASGSGAGGGSRPGSSSEHRRMSSAHRMCDASAFSTEGSPIPGSGGGGGGGGRGGGVAVAGGGDEAADDTALCCLSPTNPIRVVATGLIHFHIEGTGVSFDNLIVLLILFSSACMALEDCQLVPGSEMALFLEKANLYATYVFTAECLLKIITYGLLFTPNGYLRSGWHQLDALIVSSSVISLLSESLPASFRAMRVLRVLRPLRLIARFGNLRLVVDLFIKTLPSVGNVIMVVILFCIVFGILGVQLFAGRLAFCAAPDEAVARLPNQSECEAAGGLWGNPEMGSFDSIGAALLLLFESATMEGWPDVMFATIDAYTDQGHAPVRDYAVANSLYMLMWLLLGSMFLMNVFVGVIVETFAEIKRQEDGLTLMDSDQQQWVETMQHLLNLQPKRYPPEPSHSRWAALAYKAVGHKVFEPLILLVIVANTLLMALDGYGISESMHHLLEQGNSVCTVIFLCEAVLKIYAMTMGEYLRHAWNVFDFVVVIVSIGSEVFEYFVNALGKSPAGPSPSLLRSLRTIRVMRIVRTVKSFKGLRTLFTTLLLALPALGNIMAIFLIVLTLYSVLGMHLFGGVAHGDYLDDNANFCSFSSAFLLMLRCATGESWNGIMHDAMVQPGEVTDTDEPRCHEEAGDCGSTAASMIFFISFQVISSMVILNMMIALILEEYSKSINREKHKVNDDDAEAFVDLWAEYDPYASGRMHVRHLHAFIKGLPPPLGLDRRNYAGHHLRDSDVSAHIAFLEQVEAYPNAVTGAPEVVFNEILQALSRTVLKEVEGTMESLQGEVAVVRDLQLMREAAARRNAAFAEPQNNLVELHSACVIQRRWGNAAKMRARRNIQSRREAIRLRQAGSLVPEAFVGRVQHSTITYRGRLFIFGGRSEGKMLKDFWEFSLNTGYWLDQTHTVPLRMRGRCGHTVQLCGSRMVVLGGHDGQRFLSDVWECELNGLYWRQVGFTPEDRAEQKARQLGVPLELENGSGSGGGSGGGGSRGGEGGSGGGGSPESGRLSAAASAAASFRHAYQASPEGLPGEAVRVPFSPLTPSGKRTRLSDAKATILHEAATLLQAQWRARAARVLLVWMRANADLEYDAATYLQACARRFLILRRRDTRADGLPGTSHSPPSREKKRGSPRGRRGMIAAGR